MSVIEIKGLTKKFGKFTALDNVDLIVDQGDIHGFIGPNGSGKSTTIRVLLGMLKANSGQVLIYGQDAWQQAVVIHERIAYVPGEANLWPNLSGGEVIDLFLKMRKQPIDVQRRDALIERFDLNPAKKCRTYSKGNRQKVALIAALAADADLYILDEPTAGLDPLMERIFQEYILKIKKKGKTVLLSSHILSEVEEVCDTISIIREGKIIESGSLAAMRHLIRLQLTVETNEPITALTSIAGVHQVSQSGLTAKFQVDNAALPRVISYISQFGVTKLSSNPPTLEDIFLRRYHGVDAHDFADIEAEVSQNV